MKTMRRAAGLCAVLYCNAVCRSITVTGTVQFVGTNLGPADSSSVVVWLEPVSGSRITSADTPARIEHKMKRIEPYLSVVQRGTRVIVQNEDLVFHSMFASSPSQSFNFAPYAPRAKRGIRMTQSGVFRLFCKLHAMESALIIVTESQWFARADSQGTFSISGVPDGKYELRMYHERVPSSELAAQARIVVVQRGQDRAHIGAITLLAASYLQGPETVIPASSHSMTTEAAWPEISRLSRSQALVGDFHAPRNKRVQSSATASGCAAGR